MGVTEIRNDETRFYRETFQFFDAVFDEMCEHLPVSRASAMHLTGPSEPEPDPELEPGAATDSDHTRSTPSSALPTPTTKALAAEKAAHATPKRAPVS